MRRDKNADDAPQTETPEDAYDRAWNEDGESTLEDQSGTGDAADQQSSSDESEQQAADESEQTANTDTEQQTTVTTDQDTTEEPDIWADAPEALRTQHQELLAQNKKLEQANRSHQGRLSAMQLKINQQQHQSPPAENQPSAGDVKEAMKTPEQWAAFKEEYPDIHAAVESRMEQNNLHTQTQIQQHIDQAIQPLQAAEQERAQAQELAALEAAHPDWATVVQADDFKYWMMGQPPQMHAMLKGDTAHEVGTVLSLYGSATQVAPKHSTIDDLKARRQQQLTSAVGIPTKSGPGAGGTIPRDDWDAAWDATSDD